MSTPEYPCRKRARERNNRANRQTNRQISKQTNGQTNRQTNDRSSGHARKRLGWDVPSGRLASTRTPRRSAACASEQTTEQELVADLRTKVVQSRRRCGWGEPSPGADVGRVSPVPAQMWRGGAHAALARDEADRPWRRPPVLPCPASTLLVLREYPESPVRALCVPCAFPVRNLAP